VTLGRLALAWLPVALWFVVASTIPMLRMAEGGWRSPRITWPAAEALVVTLFATLWFDSLGRGEWWLLFLLVGLLAGFPARLEQRTGEGEAQAPLARRVLLLGLWDVARYVIAGAILSWRLA
jgi:hypothetical protein